MKLTTFLNIFKSDNLKTLVNIIGQIADLVSKIASGAGDKIVSAKDAIVGSKKNKE